MTNALSKSCTISVARDGDVAFVIGTETYRPGQACTVVLEGRRLLVQQAGFSIVEIDDVGEQNARDIAVAGQLRVFNILHPGRSSETIHINKEVSLVAR